MPGPLHDVNVLDLTWHVAGPYCTKLFADYGAKVTKIERPGTGDPARSIGPFFHDKPHVEHSALFLHLNTNKRSVTLDLQSTNGLRLVKRLVEKADVLAESFRPGVMERLGLGYEVLRRLNPRLVFLSISSFGQTGPYQDFESSELTLFAMSGAMIGEGARDREPLKYAGWQAL
ncbi:MAG: CoA transferase, partial [Chloroflexi bacterium]|nr:CoA transferase [Chloroflexota bacterium]